MMFGFQSIGHFFATVAHDLVKAAKVTADVIKQVQAAEPLIEEITSVIYPPAAIIERGAFAMLGLAVHAVSTADKAMDEKGWSLTLDLQTINEIRALIPALEAFAKSKGLEKPTS